MVFNVDAGGTTYNYSNCEIIVKYIEVNSSKLKSHILAQICRKNVGVLHHLKLSLQVPRNYEHDERHKRMREALTDQ